MHARRPHQRAAQAGKEQDGQHGRRERVGRLPEEQNPALDDRKLDEEERHPQQAEVSDARGAGVRAGAGRPRPGDGTPGAG